MLQDILNVLKEIKSLLRRGFFKGGSINLNVSSSDYNPGKTFFLYVGTEGVLKVVDETGATITRKFVTGYHLIPLSKVLTDVGNTADDLAACFLD